jgi:hypothetical protein
MTTLLATATAVAGVGAVAVLLPGLGSPAPAAPTPTASSSSIAAASGAAPAVTAPDAGAPAVSAPTVIAPPKLVAAAPANGCADVETIGIRGTTEPQGGGIVAGPLASALQKQLDQTVKTFNLVYPASFDYQRSKAQGVTALRAELSKTSAACPDTEFVLIGYSQGADVIGDTLQSGTVPAADQIGAVAMFGDPAFNSKEEFVVGSFRAGTNGVFPRRTGALDEFSDRIVSFCNSDDTFCQRGANGTGHFRYGADRQKAVDAVEGELG